MTKLIDTRQHRERGRGRKAFWILAAVALAVLLVGAFRGSREAHGARGHRPGSHQEVSAERIRQLFAEGSPWPEQLGIDEDQRPRIAAVLESSVARLEEISAEQEVLREELSQAFTASEFDPEQVEELRWKAAEIAVRALDEGFDVAVDLAEVLTPEQRRDIVEHWEDRR